MLYRFNRFYLGDWAAMDRELKAAAASFLGETDRYSRSMSRIAMVKL